MMLENCRMYMEGCWMAWGAVCLMGLDRSELWAVILELWVELYTCIVGLLSSGPYDYILQLQLSKPIPLYTHIIVSRTHPCPSSPVPDPIT